MKLAIVEDYKLNQKTGRSFDVSILMTSKLSELISKKIFKLVQEK